ncbi:CGNR zinc finger domain-containing protein [Nocardiopsis suaedae]|uniref:CGNR zinc finger domain-containing protein n=1 Tax=Nocardiopsis suaedae TaxID=3018444 RepID=A0ABT4TF59_9ACTN|nr:CGNR zinc finger domain-containing protein [Nocardiopsis suaedae]MDA2803261.1 CGNR zinc finger domain-containing protein [Nocardiopsis suaedae]
MEDTDTSTISPAPGAELYSALDFANSAVSLPGGKRVDLLGGPGDAARWLVERGLASPDIVLYEPCASRMRDLREHIRALIAARIDGVPAPAQAVGAVNAAMTKVPSAALLAWDPEHGLHRSAAHPIDQAVDHALAALADNVAELLTSPEADRLTACGSPPCDRYLVRTHPRRHWCSTRCGDRARAARAYARKQAVQG